MTSLPPGFAQEGVDEQAAAHANAPVHPPDIELDAFVGQRASPGEHVLIHAVHERPVQIEKEGGLEPSNLCRGVY